MTTDEKIIKALECCEDDDGNNPKCSECPFNDLEEGECFTFVRKGILEIVKRQKAEIERLQKENEILSTNADNAFQEGLNESRELFKQEVEAEIRAEAVKEVVLKVNEAITEIYNKHIFGSNDLEAEEKDAIINFSDDVTSKVNIILKEMAGEENESD